MPWRAAQRDYAVAVIRPVSGANWRTAADVKSVHDHLSRHHAGPKIERARFDIGIGLGIGLGTSPCGPGHVRRENGQSPPWAWSCLYLPPPPSHRSRTGCTDHFHGRARSCLTG